MNATLEMTTKAYWLITAGVKNFTNVILFGTVLIFFFWHLLPQVEDCLTPPPTDIRGSLFAGEMSVFGIIIKFLAIIESIIMTFTCFGKLEYIRLQIFAGAQ